MDNKQLLNTVFNTAAKDASVIKSSGRGSQKYTDADLSRVNTVLRMLSSRLKSVENLIPDKMSALSKELLYLQVSRDKIKKEIRQIHETLKILDKISLEYEVKIKFAENRALSNRLRQGFYGRISSVVKKLRISELDKVPKVLNILPNLKDLRTCILIGFPNVGKSSILKALCGSNVEIQPYPFTTKGISLGYFMNRYEQVQMLDTPGMFDRPFSEMNDIEKRAFVALKHVSKDVVFVADPSEGCGFPLEKQLNLLKKIKEEFDPNILLVAAKTDLPHKDLKSDIEINTFDANDIEKLRQAIIAKFFKN